MPVYEDKTAKNKSKKWYFNVYYTNDNGERKTKKGRGFASKLQATEAMREFETSLKKGTYIQPNKMTYREYMEKWLEGKATTVKASTYGTYSSLVNNHILPAIGNVDLQKITPMKLEDLYRNLMKAGRLSDENIQKVHSIIKDSLNKALRWDMILKNPAAVVDRPKASKKEIEVWDTPEVHKFLEVAKLTRNHMAFLLAVTTGMRQGEILGLRWKDIDFLSGNLSIIQTLSHDGKELSIGAKTSAGNRVIAIDAETLNALEKHRLKYNEEKMASRNIYEDNNLVISTSVGTPLSPRNLVRSFDTIIEKAKVKKIRFHDLRHTHATLLLKQGVNPKIVAERLGHANVRITLDTYSHLLPTMQKDTAETFGRVFYKNEDLG